MTALKVDGHNLTLCVRCDFLTLDEAISRYEHNAREATHTKKIKYLRHDSSSNRYFILSEFNGNGNMNEIAKNNKEFNRKDTIKNLLNNWLDKFKADYEAQTTTYKNGKVVKNGWRKDMVPFSEIVISFGSDRPKEQKEGLNANEVNFINAQISLDRVKRFANDYCAKYGVKCLLLSEHNDEKTRHYQLIFSNYQMDKHKNLRFRGKAETSKFGSSLQDMGQSAFGGIALRGRKGSKTKHLNLLQMHQVEREYNSEQEFKKELKGTIVKIIGKYIKKQEPLMGKKYYRLEAENVSTFTNNLTNLVLERIDSNINIVTELELKTQVEELTKQLMDKGEIIARNKELQNSNDILEEENKSLRQTNDALNNQDETINSQIKEIQILKDQISAKDNQIQKLNDTISINSEDIKRVNEFKAKAKRLEELEAEHYSLKQANTINKTALQTAKEDNDNYKKQIDHLNKQLESVNDQSEYIELIKERLNFQKEENQKLSNMLNLTQDENTALKSEIALLKAFNAKIISCIKMLVDKMPQIKARLPSWLLETMDEAQKKVNNIGKVEIQR